MSYYKIAICDDDNDALIYISELIRKEFAKAGCNTIISVFDDPVVLINEHKINDYDTTFLDIDMPKINGIEVAKIIKNQHSKTLIIFITSKDELVFNSFEVHPFGFVRKLKMHEELPKIIADITSELSKNNYMIQFKIEGICYKLYAEEIVFIESKGNYIIINTVDRESYKYKDSINKKEEELLKYNFVRTHERFLINLKYILSINKNTVTVIQNYDMPVSRHRVQKVKERFLGYYGRDKIGG